MIVLRDELKTRFLLDCRINQIMQYLDSLPEGETIDLGGCRMEPGIENRIRQYYKKFNFVDMIDSELNELLQHNCKVAKSVNQPQRTAFDTDVTGQRELLEYMQNFDPTLSYRVGPKVPTAKRDNVEISKSIAMAILIIMKHPETEVDLNLYAEDLFKQVRLKWIPLESHDRYVEVNGMSVVYRDCKNGYVHVPGIGDILESVYVSDYLCLPAEFGTEKLYGNPEFEDVWAAALDRVLLVKDKDKSMKDVIKIRGDN